MGAPWALRWSCLVSLCSQQCFSKVKRLRRMMVFKTINNTSEAVNAQKPRRHFRTINCFPYCGVTDHPYEPFCGSFKVLIANLSVLKILKP